MTVHQAPSASMKSGFTLAELLIALIILSTITIFSIPKILRAQQVNTFNSIGKEAAGTISNAFQQYKIANGTIPVGFTMVNLTPYMNYIKVDSATPIDDWQTGGQHGCDSTNYCLLMANGSRMLIEPRPFCNTSNLSYMHIQVDPDGVYSGTTTGPGKAVDLILYRNGFLTTVGTLKPSSFDHDCAIRPADPTLDPPWFSW